MNKLTLNTFLHISLLFLSKLSYIELSFTLFTFLLQSGKISMTRYSKYIQPTLYFIVTSLLECHTTLKQGYPSLVILNHWMIACDSSGGSQNLPLLRPSSVPPVKIWNLRMSTSKNFQQKFLFTKLILTGKKSEKLKIHIGKVREKRKFPLTVLMSKGK